MSCRVFIAMTLITLQIGNLMESNVQKTYSLPALIWNDLLLAAGDRDTNALNFVMLESLGGTKHMQPPGIMSLLYFFIVQDAVFGRIPTPITSRHASIPEFCRFILTHCDELNLDFETLRDELKGLNLFPPFDSWEGPTTPSSNSSLFGSGGPGT